jgi:hypothetical protein
MMIRWMFPLLLLMVAAPALAHNPRAEGDDWGNFDAPYVVEDGAVSFAFFGALAPGNDLDVYQLTFSDDDRLRLELLIPVCGDIYADYYPRILVLGAGDAPLIGDDLAALLLPDADASTAPAPTPEGEALAASIGAPPDDLSLLYTYDSRPADDNETRTTYYEHHTRRDYYEAETVDLDVTAGDYTLVVFDPADAGGDYLLASGYVETFFPPLPSEPEMTGMDWRASWPAEECR